MFFTMPCPSCGKSLKGRDDLVGRTATCPYCRAGVTVQRPAEKPAEAPADAFAFDKHAGATGKPSPSKAIAQAPAARAGASAAAFGSAADTNVGVLRHVVVGIVGTAAFYGLLWPIAWSGDTLTYLGRLFIGTSTMAQGGWVPIAEVFLFFWAIGMLVEKWFKIRRQQRGLLFDVLPMDLGDTITLDNLDRFVSHIRSLPRDAAGTFLVTRCLRGLEHFRVRKSAPDTATMLSSQSDIDASNVDSSYTMFHVFIWAIPILGFLGTVIGVSAAVGSFTGTLESSSDIGAMKAALKGITGGLATAFDTTLVALSMAMILTFPVSGLQKYEGDILGQVDEYTNENFLRRLDDGRGGGAERGLGGSRSEVQRALDTALAPHREELRGWTESLRAIGGELASQVKEGWSDVNARLLEEHERQAARVGEIDALVTSARAELAAVAGDAATARDQSAASMAEAARSVQAYTAALERGLQGLATALEKLGEERVVVEVRRRPWWNPFGGGGRA
jgi:hypothetical protein